MKYIMDIWELHKKVKREYFEKLEEAFSRGLMTTEEYEHGKAKASIRILKEVNRQLNEQEYSRG